MISPQIQRPYPYGGWLQAFAADADHDIEVQITAPDGSGQPDTANAVRYAIFQASTQLIRTFPVELPSGQTTPFFLRARHVRIGKNPSNWTPWRRVVPDLLAAFNPPSVVGGVPALALVDVLAELVPGALAILNFDEGRGITVGETTGGPALRVNVAGAGWLRGPLGPAYDFDKTGEAKIVHESQHDVGGGVSFTIDALVRWDGSGGQTDGVVVRHDEDYELAVEDDGDLIYRIRDHWATQTPGVNLATLGLTGKWCNLKLQYAQGSSTATIYVNGRLVATHVAAGAASGTALGDALKVGYRTAGAGTGHFNGAIGYVRVATGILEDFPYLVQNEGLADQAVKRENVAATLASDLVNRSGDLVMNGDFEAGLSWWRGTISNGSYAIITSSPYKGAKSLRLNGGTPIPQTVFLADTPADDQASGSPLKIRVTPGQFLLFLATGKASAGTGQVQLRKYDHAGADTGFVAVLTFTTTSYVPKATIVQVPTDVFYVGIECGHVAAGGNTYDFDEIHLYPITPGLAGFFDNGTKTGAFTIDWNNAPTQWVEVNGTALAITLSNPVDGGALVYVLYLKQNSAPDTVTWPGSVHWLNGVTPTLSATTGRIDRVELQYIGGVYYGTFTQYFT